MNGINDSVKEQDKHLLSDKKYTMCDIPEETAMLEWAGIHFGEVDTYKLQHSIRKLAAMTGGDNFKFVGKIYCKDNDYWVVQGTKATVLEEGMT